MPQAFTAQDIFCHRRIDGVHAASVHDFAVFSVGALQREADCRTSAVWCVRLAGGEPHQLTSGTGRDDTPRVSPDGRHVAFLSDRAGGVPQVHVIDSHGGEARRLGHFARAVRALEWSPDGRRLLVSAELAVDEGAAGPVPADAPEVVRRLPYKLDGVGCTVDREIHLFVLDVASGDGRRVTHGHFDVGSACWSPDGLQIAYTRTREGRLALRSDLWVAAADGSGARQVSHELASVSGPAWSPDGRWIAFAGARDEGDTQRRLWLHDVQAGSVRPLGAEDLALVDGERLHWQDDSEVLLAVLASRGLQQLTEIGVPGGQRRVLVDGERHVAHFALARGYLVYAAEGPSTPDELFASDLDGRYEVPLTALNDWWRERSALQAERRRFAVPDGDGGMETIEGWLLRPPHCEGRATPWLVDVHGGPADYVRLAYAAHPYWPVLVSRGWSVLALDAAGSGSYGRDFSARLRGRWGALDLPQHLAVLEQLRREGLADERVAIAGQGYGGFVAAWAVGAGMHFRAAAIGAPMVDLEALQGSADQGCCQCAYALCGTPGVERVAARALSPLAQAARARTPTLILQGKADQRCPVTQAEELFVALMNDGQAPCEMVLYPGGSHQFLEHGRPSQRLDATQRVVDWLEQWVDQPLHAAVAPIDALRSDGSADAAAHERATMRGEAEPAH